MVGLDLPNHKSAWPKPEFLEERFKLFKASRKNKGFLGIEM